MIKFIDDTTIKVVSAFAEFVARVKGKNNFSFGANFLALTSISLGIVGLIEALNRGSWRMGGGIVTLVVFGILVAGVWEVWGNLEYTKGINPNEEPNLPRVSHMEAYRKNIVVRWGRVFYTCATYFMIARLPVGIEKVGITAIFITLFFIALWLLLYLPTVNKDRIRPYLYVSLQ